jgi:hypothetical protein
MILLALVVLVTWGALWAIEPGVREPGDDE